jgi:hypothetical protein
MLSSVLPHFWTAVEDCLVTFHGPPRCAAAEKVTDLWRKLPSSMDGSGSAFSDMIYHAERWQIACNLAGQDLPIAAYQPAYQALLTRNSLLG